MNYIFNKETDFAIEKLREHLQDNCFLDTKKDNKKNVFIFFQCCADYMFDVLNLRKLYLHYELEECSIYFENIFNFNGLVKWDLHLVFFANSFLRIQIRKIYENDLTDLTIKELKKLDTSNIIKMLDERQAYDIFNLRLKEEITKENLINCLILYCRIYVLLNIKSSEIIKNMMCKN